MSYNAVKHLISWSDWSDDEIQSILDFAVYVKHNRVYFAGHMAGRTMAMLFQRLQLAHESHLKQE